MFSIHYSVDFRPLLFGSYRTKPTVIEGDNCCLCNFAAVRCMSKLNSKDILYASFVNHIFETPFFVTADHETSSVVVVIRGSISLQDVFTDLTADGEEFDAVEAPPGSYVKITSLDNNSERFTLRIMRYFQRCRLKKEFWAVRST